MEKFWTLKGIKKGTGEMTTLDLEKMIQKFEKTGSFDVQFVTERKRIVLVTAEEVFTVVLQESSSGVQPCTVRGIV